MKTYRILYNPEAGNGRCKEEALTLRDKLTDGECTFHDMTVEGGYADLLRSLGADDVLVVAGGDGTLNRFINDTEGLLADTPVYYYAAGSGNDFLHDLGGTKGEKPIRIDRYLKDLPTVTVNGQTARVLNGVGYGIDGYCCEVGDRLRALSDKPINYAGIAIKGLLFHYKPTNAVITVDGKEYRFKKVWLAPTMHGRFYGGGMMPTPAQDRLDPEGKLSVMVMHGSGKLKTLMIFPSIFSGKHVEKTKNVTVLTGRDITVTFDRPVALQIDGETILGVTTCRTVSHVDAPATAQSEAATV